MAEPDVFKDLRRKRNKASAEFLKVQRDAAKGARRVFLKAIAEFIETPTHAKCSALAGMWLLQAAQFAELAEKIQRVEQAREYFEQGMAQAGQGIEA